MGMCNQANFSTFTGRCIGISLFFLINACATDVFNVYCPLKAETVEMTFVLLVFLFYDETGYYLKYPCIFWQGMDFDDINDIK